MSEFIIFNTFDDDGEEFIHRLPARFEVCGRCHGRTPTSDQQPNTKETPP